MRLSKVLFVALLLAPACASVQPGALGVTAPERAAIDRARRVASELPLGEPGETVRAGFAACETVAARADGLQRERDAIAAEFREFRDEHAFALRVGGWIETFLTAVQWTAIVVAVCALAFFVWGAVVKR